MPLQNSIGDGGLYTIWAGLLGIVAVLILILLKKGEEWRKKDLEKESRL